MLCVEIQKELMTAKEVARAYREFEVEDEHLGKLLVEIETHYGLAEVSKYLKEMINEY